MHMHMHMYMRMCMCMCMFMLWYMCMHMYMRMCACRRAPTLAGRGLAAAAGVPAPRLGRRARGAGDDAEPLFFTPPRAPPGAGLCACVRDPI